MDKSVHMRSFRKNFATGVTRDSDHVTWLFKQVNGWCCYQQELQSDIYYFDAWTLFCIRNFQSTNQEHLFTILMSVLNKSASKKVEEALRMQTPAR
jgi:hypothetical protein